LVPWTCARFGWWLKPDHADTSKNKLHGAALIVGLYALSLLVFSHLH
jgi:hypothetical protein